jgi:hypothetical protein
MTNTYSSNPRRLSRNPYGKLVDSLVAYSIMALPLILWNSNAVTKDSLVAE